MHPNCSLTILSVSVDSWEYRTDSINGEKFTVYRIVLRDSTERQWSVYRRFSDFTPFDVQVRKILPQLSTTLPSREFIRPLAGLFGWKAPEPSISFLDERRKSLDEYVKSILNVAGGHKTSLWNHPVVLTFFDIPTVVQPRDSPASDLNCPLPLGEWNFEMDRLKQLLSEALETRGRMTGVAARGHDHSNYRKHLKRQITSAQKSQSKMQLALDFFARVDKIDDNRLSEMSLEFQRLAGQVEALHSQFVNDEANSIPPKSQKNRVGSPKSGPIARTPVRASSSSLSMGGGGTGVGAGASKKSATPPGEGGGGGKQEFTIDTQLSLIKSQDAQLSELSSIIQRQRNLGEAIGKELDDQNDMIGDLEISASGTQTKLNTANRRVKRV